MPPIIINLDKLLGKEYNTYVNHKIISIIVNYKPLLQTIKRLKLTIYKQISRHYGLSKMLMQGMVEIRKRGHPKKQWLKIIFQIGLKWILRI